MKEGTGAKEAKEATGAKEAKESKEAKKAQEAKEAKEWKEIKGYRITHKKLNGSLTLALCIMYNVTGY